jgi:hypothetical protein
MTTAPCHQGKQLRLFYINKYFWVNTSISLIINHTSNADYVNVHIRNAVISLNNLTTWLDSNPGLLFLWWMRWPSHPSNSKQSVTYLNVELFITFVEQTFQNIFEQTFQNIFRTNFSKHFRTNCSKHISNKLVQKIHMLPTLRSQL